MTIRSWQQAMNSHQRRAIHAQRCRPLVPLLLTACLGLPAQDTDLRQQVSLEAARQELVQQRLDQVHAECQALLEDIASNGAEDSVVTATLKQRLQALEQIREQHLAPAIQTLQQVIDQKSGARQLADARHNLQQAAQALAGLILHGGMARAEQVFAAELGDIDARIHELGTSSQLAGRLEDLVERVTALPGDVEEPLATVRVAQARKHLQQADATKLMRTDQTTEARALLREVQHRLRPELALHDLVRARDHLQMAADAVDDLQQAIAARDGAGSDPDWKPQIASIHRALGNLAGLLHDQPVLGKARQHLQEAGKRLPDTQKKAIDDLQQAKTALIELVATLLDRIDGMRESELYYKQLQMADSRKHRIQGFTDRLSDLVDTIDKALIEQVSIDGQGKLVDNLVSDIGMFRDRLGDADKWSTATAAQLERVLINLKPLREQVAANQPGDAIDSGLRSLESLEEALDITREQTEYLEERWSLSQAIRDLKDVNDHVGNLRAEQEDLLARFEDSDAADLQADQAVFLAGVERLREQLASLPEARAADEQLGQAEEQMTEALELLAEGKKPQAKRLLEQAGAYLAASQEKVDASIERSGYLATVIEDLGKQLELAISLLQKQIAMRERAQIQEQDRLSKLFGVQVTLSEETRMYVDHLVQEDIAESFTKAHNAMKTAEQELKQNSREPAVAAMRAAEAGLREGIQGLKDYIAAMRELMEELQEEPEESTEAPTMMDATQQVLFLAIQQERLRVEWEAARAKHAQEFIDRQTKIWEQTYVLGVLCEEAGIFGYWHVNNAIEEQEMVMTALTAQDWDAQPGLHMLLAEHSLRRAFSSMMVSLHTPAEEEEDDFEMEEGEPMEMDEQITLLAPDPQGAWATFVAGSPGGEDVAKTASEFESLTEREREALNQNFARELPLEYQALLQDYFQTLSR